MDLASIYDWIRERSGASTALRFADGLERYCAKFGQFPERGTRRDDLQTGLRTIGYRGTATIAFTVSTKDVVILRILYRGRSLEDAFDEA